jgi:hypothetical protein
MAGYNKLRDKLNCLLGRHKERTVIDPLCQVIKTGFMAQDNIVCSCCGKFLRTRRIYTSALIDE